MSGITKLASTVVKEFQLGKQMFREISYGGNAPLLKSGINKVTITKTPEGTVNRIFGNKFIMSTNTSGLTEVSALEGNQAIDDFIEVCKAKKPDIKPNELVKELLKELSYYA